MKVTLLLADAAQAMGGKLYILGGGWSNIMAPAPFAIALKVEVPWNLATQTHTFRLELVDADGQDVEVETMDGMQPLVVEGQFSTGIAPGMRQGTPMDAVAAISFPPLPFEVGRYAFRLSIDGKSDEDWSLAFNRINPPQALAA
jgi:hypothetical protein